MLVSSEWGLLANPELDRQSIKAVYFFAGNWRSHFNPTQFYEYPAPPNDQFYTIHPSDARHLGWSEQPENRDFALDTMLAAGANVIAMSFWGQRGTDRWAFWAPMQTSTFAHDELFAATVEKPILIMPVIEGGAQTIGLSLDNHEGNSPGFEFQDHFPLLDSQLVVQIEDLLDRYLLHPIDALGQSRPEWSDKWVQMYDRDGQKRFAIYLLHVAALWKNLGEGGYAAFAQGFDRVAQKVFDDTGIVVGFTLDLLRRPIFGDGTGPTPSPDVYYPTPETVGTLLSQQPSVLAVQGFIPEISLDFTHTEAERIDLKHEYFTQWREQGLPVILDVSPGYDAHLVFPVAPIIYGNTPSWRNALTQLIRSQEGQKGIVFNTWNGYTEGYAAIPTLEYGDATFLWLQALFKN